MNSHDLHALAQQLPLLAFDPHQDADWPQSDLPQAYLNYYHINFANEFAGVTHGFGSVEAAGYRIATHYWLPENAQGTLVVLHGYYDHVGVFDKPIRYALERNLAVLAFDLPGHGLSSGEPAVIDSFDTYADVLAIMLTRSQALMPKPWYALGQSTGCAVLLNYLWRYAIEQDSVAQFAKIALCSPLVLARGWRGSGQFVYALLRHFLKRIARGHATSSHDQDFNAFLRQDPLQSRYLSVRWVGAMKAWHEQFVKFAPLQKALFIVQGTGDLTVDWRYNIPLIQQKLPNATVTYVAGAGHQLVNESDEYRTQVFSAIDHFLVIT